VGVLKLMGFPKDFNGVRFWYRALLSSEEIPRTDGGKFTVC